MLGVNFGVVKLYPMALHDTLMNALLFNVCLFLAGSLAVLHLCAISFADYARFTAVVSIFDTQVRHAAHPPWRPVYVCEHSLEGPGRWQISQLRGISVIFSIYVYVLLSVTVLTAIYLAFRRYKRAKDPNQEIEMVTFD
jgi:hypothetical protein